MKIINNRKSHKSNFFLKELSICCDETNNHLMDFRDYGIGAQILSALGINKLILLTRDSRRVIGLEGYGLEIVKRVKLLFCNEH